LAHCAPRAVGVSSYRPSRGTARAAAGPVLPCKRRRRKRLELWAESFVLSGAFLTDTLKVGEQAALTCWKKLLQPATIRSALRYATRPYAKSRRPGAGLPKSRLAEFCAEAPRRS